MGVVIGEGGSSNSVFSPAAVGAHVALRCASDTTSGCARFVLLLFLSIRRRTGKGVFPHNEHCEGTPEQPTDHVDMGSRKRSQAGVSAGWCIAGAICKSTVDHSRRDVSRFRPCAQAWEDEIAASSIQTFAITQLGTWTFTHVRFEQLRLGATCHYKGSVKARELPRTNEFLLEAASDFTRVVAVWVALKSSMRQPHH